MRQAGIRVKQALADFGPAAIDEAIRSLGLVYPDAGQELLVLLARTVVPDSAGVINSPKSLCTKFRGSGEQLTPAQKRALGIRGNAYMNRRALSQITEKGRARPLAAHEVTLLRAMFTVTRATRVQAVVQAQNSALKIKHEQLHNCIACAELAGLGDVAPRDAVIFPPGGCEREACSLSIRVTADYFAMADANERGAVGTEISGLRRLTSRWRELLVRLARTLKSPPT